MRNVILFFNDKEILKLYLEEKEIESIITWVESGSQHAYKINQKEHQYIYECIKELWTMRRTIDVITLTDQLSKRGFLDLVGGQDYLYEISIFVMTTATSGEYAKIVKEKAVLRSILKACQGIVGDVYDQKDTIEILDAIQKRIFDLTQYDTTDTTQHIKEILEQRIEEHMALVDNPELVNQNKIMSGYTQLDHMTG